MIRRCNQFTSSFRSSPIILFVVLLLTSTIVYTSIIESAASSTASSTLPRPAAAPTSIAMTNNVESASPTSPTSTTSTNTTAPAAATIKTVFFVRHAESDENRRLHSLKTAFKDLTRFAVPKMNDVKASLELIRLDQQIDSNVSQFGKEQIAYMANILRENNFISEQRVQLLVHSPLLRAKETCRDMFACNASDETGPLRPPLSPPSGITEVVELDALTEMTPLEWIPGNTGSLQKRMSAFENWLSQRPETTIVCVGHSQYFKALLQLPYKFQNCDVIKVQFDPSAASTASADNNSSSNTTIADSKWSNIQDAHLCRLKKPSDGDDSKSTSTSTAADTCSSSNNTAANSTESAVTK